MNNININKKKSILYIVPTPIGNIYDITYRAVYILKNVDIILAEDKRKTGIILKNFSINTNMISLNSYNEKNKTNDLILKLKKGKNIAIVSDAGTPLINDPGSYLVKCCIKEKILIIPLPGPCAAITALSASGLYTNKFCYEGFLPKKKNSRLNYLKILKKENRTIIIYESRYRLINTLIDIKKILGENRSIVIVKELTKTWEYIKRTNIKNLLIWLQKNKNFILGEIILIIEGCNKNNIDSLKKALKFLKVLHNYLPIKKSIKIISNLYKIKKNILYKNYIV
ncbi:16S rRNA (cytidine(1402)-2'-O)-methyltransferase [Sodalis-like secondary symbiont of Drepanosiphum platanoidis]|uniref:16S rRNA (cytidine(1402)-2'-O)-methyltransferase n=1 Tax=Sodalis-like secondary symbiont of Drepanosiphum platanoidis TaxID=2994493 RepID=UPI003463DB8D